MSLDEAEHWPDLLADRSRKGEARARELEATMQRRVRRKYWWRFQRAPPDLYAALAPLDGVL